MSPYAHFLELIRRQHELVANDQLAELARVEQQIRELIASLPLTPPVSALPLLEEARRVLDRTDELLQAARAELTAELEQVGRGRQAMTAYSRA